VTHSFSLDTETRVQLERILNSHQFRTSKRCHALLRHLTERALAGDIAGLKERSLGVEVFGRPADYDSNQDPVVRATAAEIRKRLAQYYQEPEHSGELRITLVSGSYVPEFHQPEIPTAPPVALPGPGARARRWPRLAAGLTVIAVGILLALWFTLRPVRTPLEQFWAPVLQAKGDVLICMGQPVVYNLRSIRDQDRIQAPDVDSPKTDTPAPKAIPLKDLVILRDRYVTLNDAISLVKLTTFLDRHGKPFHVRGDAFTSSADLSERPALLIGAFDNQWTRRLAGQLRFTFAQDASHEVSFVQDRQRPDRRDWKVAGAWPSWDIDTDYAIVSRVFDVNTDHPVVIAAGITHFGTVAAGDFLTDPEHFAEMIPLVPANWRARNLQVVLKVPVVHGAAGHPRVAAVHVW
jgi:hypothetical protein